MAFFNRLRTAFLQLPVQARLALIGFGCSTVMVALLITAQLVYSYYDALTNAESRLTNATHVLASYADRTFVAVTQYAGEARNALVNNKDAGTRLNDIQIRARKAIGPVRGLLVWDGKGSLRFGGPGAAALVNLPQSAAWGTLKKSDDAIIGTTLQLKNGEYVLPLIWPVRNKAEFQGAVVMLLEIGGLSDFIHDAKSHADTMTALYKTDGTVLLFGDATRDYLGQNHGDEPIFKNKTDKNGFTTASWIPTVNNMDKHGFAKPWLMARENIAAAPLMVAQLERKSSALHAWQAQRAAFVILGIAVIGLLSAVTALITKQALRQARIETNLNNVRERYHLAVSGTNDGIWDWDLVSNEIYYSPVWFQILGYEPNELPPETATWTHNIHPEDVETAHKKLQAHLDGDSEMFNDTHRMRQRDGSYIWIEAKARAVRNAYGQPIRMVGTITNVEQRKRYELALKAAKEQAEAANVSKSRFLANMSHELRTPLNGIIGFSEITRDQLFGPVGSPKYIEYANDIHHGATHLLSLINDILDFSKIDAGKYDLSLKPLDVRATVEHVLRMMRTVAIDKKITLELELPRDVPLLTADDRALRQILLNLLSNAIKFSKVGSKVTVRGERAFDGGFDIAVTDQGKGIPDEFHAKVFEPFEQVDDIFSRTHKGTGLGLPLVKALIEMHGGTVNLTSVVNRGTTVTLHFPAKALMAPDLRTLSA